MELPNKKWKPVIASQCTVDVVGIHKGVLAISKPVGMDTIQISGWTSGLPRLMDIVYSEYPQARFLNRIDRDTSGLVLFALSKALRTHLSNMWFGAGNETMRRKIYLAVIRPPDWKYAKNENDLKKPKTQKWEKAETTFEVIAGTKEYALVKCELTSHGRTHQIRKHLAQLGSPIIGDTLYKGERTELRRGQLLHAWINSVRLPNDEWVHFQSQVPADFPKDLSIKGGTCIKRLNVNPLTPEEQLESYKLYKQPKVPGTTRREGEAYPDFLARRAESARIRDTERNLALFDPPDILRA